jgi:hypothetical protein
MATPSSSSAVAPSPSIKCTHEFPHGGRCGADRAWVATGLPCTTCTKCAYHCYCPVRRSGGGALDGLCASTVAAAAAYATSPRVAATTTAVCRVYMCYSKPCDRSPCLFGGEMCSLHCGCLSPPAEKKAVAPKKILCTDVIAGVYPLRLNNPPAAEEKKKKTTTGLRPIETVTDVILIPVVVFFLCVYVLM